MKKNNEIRIPNLGPNDEIVFLNEWLVKDGDFVEKGLPIVNIENTKSNIEIDAETDGFIYLLVESNLEVSVGQVVAVISENRVDKSNILTNSNTKQDFKNSKYQLSRKAQSYIEENEILLDELSLAIDKIYTENEIRNIVGQPAFRENKNDRNHSSHSQKVFIYGGGGHSKMCIEILRQTHQYEIVGIVDDIKSVGTQVLGITVLGDKTMLKKLLDEGINKVIIGIGAIEQPDFRKQKYFELKGMGFEFPNLIHPRAIIEPSAKIGEGNQIMANAVIGSSVSIGNNNIINSGATISHDCIVKSNTHITPGAVLAGSVKINDNVVIGMLSTIFMKLEVGRNAIIYNNCRVTRNVMENEVVKFDV